MPIKKSSLEKKWYYRVAKVFFTILPLFVVVAALFKGYIKIGSITAKNIAVILQKNTDYIVYAVVGLVLYYLILKIVWRTFIYLVFGGIEDDTFKKVSSEVQPANPASQVIPIIIIILVFAVFALSQNGYIKLPQIDPYFGKTNPVKIHTYGTSCTTSDGKTGLYGTNGNCYSCSSGSAATNPLSNNCSNGTAGVYCCSTSGGNNGEKKTEKCIPTGCGTLWRCSGNYYVGDKQISVNGLCFPSGMRPAEIYSGWSGTCRQCP